MAIIYRIKRWRYIQERCKTEKQSLTCDTDSKTVMEKDKAKNVKKIKKGSENMLTPKEKQKQGYLS